MGGRGSEPIEIGLLLVPVKVGQPLVPEGLEHIEVDAARGADAGILGLCRELGLANELQHARHALGEVEAKRPHLGPIHASVVHGPVRGRRESVQRRQAQGDEGKQPLGHIVACELM